ncbi:hypothetical protein OGR47_19175 (plasmid) [Methylocystis sp. MJC1]|jgi:hypothetical protein|uniref:hypothetical protein n=1 Tax=Methylocystis sp. MJC1 TaxID=2654282 RepID=UPI0013EC5AEC|nr:hypothetical protein [Methylocystis sp. MJC1]MBU6529068.1 hypothetical protein [Methylocystis sp. MJC1]UZX14008.1 hypothetical protein OGR47_19175 [Methylocystis sp. MJC1]
MFDSGTAISWVISSKDRANSGVNQSTELDDLFERHRINAYSKSDRPSDHCGNDGQESCSRHSIHPPKKNTQLIAGAYSMLWLLQQRLFLSVRIHILIRPTVIVDMFLASALLLEFFPRQPTGSER